MISLILTQDGKSRPLHLDQSTITFGRSKENTVPLLNDKKVSRKHAKIEKAGSVWKITDLDSGNGTKVNGLRIDVHELAIEDQIKIGDAELVVRAMEDDAAGSESANMTTDVDLGAVE
ncbi:MAG TPA: FHA domain-containing protein [Planctomycetota bacterium]